MKLLRDSPCSMLYYIERATRIINLYFSTDALKAGGTTAMFDGLMNALKEIVTNGKTFVL